MATLADELAADLDFSSDEEEEQQRSDVDEEQEALDKMKQDADGDEKMESADDASNVPISSSDDDPHSVKKIAKLLYSKQTQDVLQVCFIKRLNELLCLHVERRKLTVILLKIVMRLKLLDPLKKTKNISSLYNQTAWRPI